MGKKLTLKEIQSRIDDLEGKYYKGSSGSKGRYTGLEEDIKFYE